MSNKRYDLSAKDIAAGMHDAAGQGRDHTAARLLYASSATYGADWHSLPHTHDCIELFYVVSGVGQFRMGRDLLAVAKGDLVIINPQVEHTELSLYSHPLEYIVLGVDGLQFTSGTNGQYGVYNFHGGQEAVLRILESILQELEQRPAGYPQMCQILLEMLLILLGRYTDFSSSAEPTRRASKECATVKRYIDANFKENINLDQLAELAHVNKYYLVHSFSREYQISPINYLIQRRVKESCYLLSDTDHSLSQISHTMGFSSPSYFSQSFRKLMGMSPMEYRKQSRGPARR